MNAKDTILTAIEARGRGSVFTAKDFVLEVPRGTIDVTLSRLASVGRIRRIARGLYDCPKTSTLLNTPMPPEMTEVARAIARKHRWTIAPDGATAANELGLSQQVPAKIVYLSDGPSRKFRVGEQTITFKHASSKGMKMPNYSSRLIAQALRFLGRQNVNEDVIGRIRRTVPKKDRTRFLEEARYGTDWILATAQRIAQE